MFFICSNSLDLDVGKGSWGQDELVQSSEEGSHEGVGLGDVDFSGVVNVELSPGSWEELRDVGLHLSLGDLLSDEEDFSACLLGVISVEDLLAGWDSSGVHDWHGVVVEDVVVHIVLISTEVSGGWGISSSGGWVFLLLLSLESNSVNVGNSDKGCQDKQLSEFHFYLN